MNKYVLMLLTCALVLGACSKDSVIEEPDPGPGIDPGPSEVVADPDFHVYLCFGQSNMEGNAAVEETDKIGIKERFQVMTVTAEDAEKRNRKVGEWYKAVPPLCRWNTGLTPVDYFGRTLVGQLPEKVKVGAIVVAIGGAGIDAFDKEGYKAYYNESVDWHKGLMDLYGGNPYAKMVEMAKKAQEKGVIKGILLHQGETNNMQQDWPGKVKKIYTDLLADLELKAEDVPLLAGETLYQDQGGVCWGMNDIIARLPDVIPNAHVISSEGCTGSDEFHFTAAGYRKLGRRYANKMLALMGELTAPEPGQGLRVAGRYLQDASGRMVNLHGFVQTYSPYFNENAWNNYDVSGCLRYNKGVIDKLLSAGWEMNFVRLHMDPHWSSNPECEHKDHEPRYEGHECFSEYRFRVYLESVFIPMAEYAISKGLYVVMRPPGVSPKKIAVGDDYNEFLDLVWDIVSNHPKLKNNPHIMFELANEPVDILGPDGTYASTGQGHFDNLKIYFQTIVNTIRRNGAENVLWVPGLAYQGSYSGFANNPIEGENIGYAVHLYPGWMGSDGENEDGGVGTNGGYEPFQQGWNKQVQPVADFAPIMITEMDWAPKEYESSWGKATTGTAGGAGFGANFKYIVDNCGNVSWLLFTDPHLLAKFKDEPGEPGNYTFLNDPEACPWPCYHWFKEYAKADEEGRELSEIVILDGVKPINQLKVLTSSSKTVVVKAIYVDGSSELVTARAQYSSSDPASVSVKNGRIVTLENGNATITVSYTGPLGDSKQAILTVESVTFPLTNDLFNPSIHEKGSFDESTKTLITGQYGFGGWNYSNGLNLSGHKFLVVEYEHSSWDGYFIFRIFGENDYWSKHHAEYTLKKDSRKLVIALDEMYKVEDPSIKISPENLYIIGIWSMGGDPIVINKVYLTDTP